VRRTTATQTGVAIADALVQRGAILSKDGVFTISEVGERLMSRIGIEVDELRKASERSSSRVRIGQKVGLTSLAPSGRR
jgi:hypothetical protein